MTLDSLLSFVKERFAGSGRKVLILDYDGTLAPFAADPAEAFPYEGIRERLLKIRECAGEIVFVTGREPEEISALMGVAPPFETWGCHGAVHLKPSGKRHEPKLGESLRLGLEKAEAVLKTLGFGRVERKTTGIAFHWRGYPPEEFVQFRERSTEALKPILPLGFSLLDFDGGIELRAKEFNKGRAIREILRDGSKLGLAVFLGDDLTDEEGFAEVNRLGGAGVLVSPRYRATLARFFLVPPLEVRIFLENWLLELQGRSD